MVKVVVLDQINAGVGEISAGKTTPDQAQETGEQIGKYIVTVDPNAPSCCIDGRNCIHTLATNEADQKTSPRPSVAGGAGVTAYAAAELVGWFAPQDNRPTLDRFADVDTQLRNNGIVPGGHTAKSAVEKNYLKDGLPATGCGASDKFTDIAKRPFDSKDAVEKYTALAMGNDYNPDDMAFEDSQSVQTRLAGWNSKSVMEFVKNKSGGESIEVLEGEHAEVLVVFNYVENTTVDRDAFVAATGKQIFVVDMWYIEKMARAMAAGRPNAVELYGKLKHAMVAFQVATYATLCDGTQYATVIVPKVETEAELVNV